MQNAHPNSNNKQGQTGFLLPPLESKGGFEKGKGGFEQVAFVGPKPCPSSWKQESLTPLVKMSVVEHHNLDLTTQFQAQPPQGENSCEN